MHHSRDALSPLRAPKPTSGFAECSLPLAHEKVVVKSTSDAFAERSRSGLREYLVEKGVRKVVFCGVAVDLCLGSTVRGASDAGVGDHVVGGENAKGDLVLVGDAVAAWEKHGGAFEADVIHGVHVESLKDEFVRVVRTEEVVKELLEGSEV